MTDLPRHRPPLDGSHADAFARDGVLVIDDFADLAEVARLTGLVEPLFCGEIESGAQRMDFGDYDETPSEIERTTQIMQIHDFVPDVLEGPFARDALATARRLLGDDMELDMTMVMDKLPMSATPTPWHQDEAYWLPGLPDRRSLSIWLALDDVAVENGCMWFVPGSHAAPTRRHDWAGPRGQTLLAQVAPGEGVAAPLAPGGATVHHGNMLHMAGGNMTGDRRRRAVILNYRSGEMIAWERERGYDHRSENARDDGPPVSRALKPGHRR